MESIIPAGVALLQQLLSNTSLTSPLIAKAVDLVSALVPVIVQEYKSLKPIVSNIITVLKADPSTQADQLKALKLSEAQIDADFDAAANAALAEDAEG
jgi:hypothetical protein